MVLAGASAVRRLARRVGRLDRLLRVARADRDGRPPSPRDDFPAAQWLVRTAETASTVTFTSGLNDLWVERFEIAKATCALTVTAEH